MNAMTIWRCWRTGAILMLAVMLWFGSAARRAVAASDANTPAASCNGTFSDGTQINPANPVFLNDVPGDQLFCDFHTFAWNQFAYMIQQSPDPNNGGAVTPRFLQLAPWYNVLKVNGAPAPAAYPGGSTALSVAHLHKNKGQADGDYHLLATDGKTVLYDIRYGEAMYNALVAGKLYTEALYNQACNADSAGNCQNPLFLPPGSATTPPSPGAFEVKTAWRDFGNPGACDKSFYCDGRFGLVGMHLIQKTQTHGEWIWASFEHVANVPDCKPGSDTPIASLSPLGTPWSFFDPKRAPPSVLSSKICSVTVSPPQCNSDPRLKTHPVSYKPINVCRTDPIPAGGASAANCAVATGSAQSKSNSPGNVACLNATLRPQLTGVWQNYKMIGSLWAGGGAGPATLFTVKVFQQPIPSVQASEAVGFPNLANSTMETWAQRRATGFIPPGEPTPAGCFGCHNLSTNAKATPPAAYSANIGQFASDDLSHFPGKLPKVDTLVKSLLPATSTAQGPN